MFVCHVVEIHDEDVVGYRKAFLRDDVSAVDAFFEAVQVNAANPVLRRNRLNLLSRIRQTCGQVADLTRLDG